MIECKKCQSKWETPNYPKQTNCPFCKALLQEKPKLDPNSNEAKILKIIQDRGVEIYTKKEFIPLIMDYFPNDDFRRLLKTIIEKNGAVYVSKLTQYTGNELQINYNKILEQLATETFIPKEVLTPAVDLLCFGLNLTLNTNTLVIQPNETPLSDFEIINNEIIKYIGTDKSVVIPNSITSIGAKAFIRCCSLEVITIPNSVTEIKKLAFSECVSLKKITIPNSVTEIGWYTFDECTRLEEVIISTVTSILQGAFFNCKELSKITIPNTVTEIGSASFGGCEKIPESVKQQILKINPDAFDDFPY